MKLLSLAFSIAALAGAAYLSRAQTAASAAAPPVALITPAQWLQRQTKPIFKKGHTMPRLTRYGWDLSFETSVEFAENWNYVLQTNYLSDETWLPTVNAAAGVSTPEIEVCLSSRFVECRRPDAVVAVGEFLD